VSPLRRTALVAGIFYLVTFVASIPAVFLLAPVLDDPNYIVSAGADAQVTAGAVLDLVNALACIGTAVALFSVVRLEHEGLALGFVTTRMFEAAVIVIGVVSLLAVVTLRNPVATGAEATSLVTAGAALVAVRDWTFLIGPGIVPGLNALLLGTLMYRSRLVPRWIPILGLIGAPLLISAAVGRMFGVNGETSVWSAIGLLPDLRLGALDRPVDDLQGVRPSVPVAQTFAAVTYGTSNDAGSEAPLNRSRST
jgi:hypothetical protein